jgi:hypothetical protein
VPSYLVESYAANRADAVDLAGERASLAAELGAGVEHVGTTFLPGDEVVLHMFRARSAESLRRAALLAGLDHQRIVEAIERMPARTRKAADAT